MSPPDLSLAAEVDDVVFSEPWQAQAFAMTIAIHERGLFSWQEWTDRFSAALGAADDDAAYYRCWLRTLEELLAEKGVAPANDIDALAQAWQRAARATPHGEPILLDNDPQAV